jgi:VanZ family protein
MTVRTRRAAVTAALFLYTAFLFWYATLPAPPHLWIELFWDKFKHAAAFFVLSGVCLVALGFPDWSPRKCAVKGQWAVAYSLAVGVAIECFQMNIPGRAAERADVVADLIGAAAAVLLAVMYLRRRERLQRAAHP